MNDDHDENQFDVVSPDAARVCQALAQRNLTFATAESCTGGMIAATITDVAGSSAVFDRSYVTYSNEAKVAMLGVDGALIDAVGAVSADVAAAMAEGALARSNADVTVAVTGIAGPSGGSDIKPVGLVWFACACAWAPTLVVSHVFDNHGRAYIRGQATIFALQMAEQTILAAPEVLPPSGDA